MHTLLSATAKVLRCSIACADGAASAVGWESGRGQVQPCQNGA